MKIGYYIKLLAGKSQALNPAKLDFPHIWAVVQSWYRSILPTPKYVKEQIIWRRLKVIEKSPECWEKGNCVQCGCFMIEKTTADMGCENEPFCYPELMTKDNWKFYKKAHNIKIFELI